ncbi:hypothetical protein TWF481_011884 [Arthrobotrys musiformis]|uniref:RRM domain-containing protein n=1 Tax=Arthrobotrys musiformis TaxID=47236 RepID=A0AAV9VVC9_9PEZI
MSAENATVHVSNISSKTTEKEIRDFFSFCGKIKEFSSTPSSGDVDATLTAVITFEQPSAARTALLLDNTQLSGVPIHVSAPASLSDLQHEVEHQPELEHPRQEDKPRTAIFAEYLASGYHLGDQILQRGIEFDEKRGISSKFRKFLVDLDSKHKVTDKSRAMDESYQITNRANTGLNTVTRYLDEALSTPTGQKIHKFYLDGKKQVIDIHNEAVRLKEIKDKQEAKCTCATAGPNGECHCAPGSCSCDGCKKVGAASTEKSGDVPPPSYEPGAGASTSTSEKVTYQ